MNIQATGQKAAQPFHGILDNEGRVVTNWGQHRTTKPAVYVEPISYGDVQAVVRDASRFPTPVNPVGSIASVTDTIVNDGGTMVCLRKLDEVLGLERDAKGRRVVRVQAGCRLKKLNMWLQAHGVEVPFQAEIGEATVGSVAVGDTKESSLDAPAISRRMWSRSPTWTTRASCARCRIMPTARRSTSSSARSGCPASWSSASSRCGRRRCASRTFRSRCSSRRTNWRSA